MVASSFSFCQGLRIKSVAPAFMDLTAFSASPYAVIKTTTADGSISSIFANQSKPSCPLIASFVKFMSSNTTS